MNRKLLLSLMYDGMDELFSMTVFFLINVIFFPSIKKTFFSFNDSATWALIISLTMFVLFQIYGFFTINKTIVKKSEEYIKMKKELLGLSRIRLITVFGIPIGTKILTLIFKDIRILLIGILIPSLIVLTFSILLSFITRYLYSIKVIEIRVKESKNLTSISKVVSKLAAIMFVILGSISVLINTKQLEIGIVSNFFILYVYITYTFLVVSLIIVHFQTISRTLSIIDKFESFLKEDQER